MGRPLNLDREYLKKQISEGRDVYVPGHGVITNADDLPTQEKLDEQLPPGSLPEGGEVLGKKKLKDK